MTLRANKYNGDDDINCNFSEILERKSPFQIEHHHSVHLIIVFFKKQPKLDLKQPIFPQ